LRARAFAPPSRDPEIAAFLDEIYSACGVRGRLNRDPLALVAAYPDPADRELAGLVASTLAFGSVDLIMRACRSALEPLGDRPRAALLAMDETGLRDAWGGFQYRYCFPKDMIGLMRAARRAILESGGLEAFFLQGDSGGLDYTAAAGSFASRLKALSAPPRRRGRAATGDGEGIRGNLLPEPAAGSACKRLFLYLRWMVRSDAVDPGGWDACDPARLVVPMDTHMARVCSERLRFIPKPAADLRAALASTAGFRLYAPEDPVKFDFSLTRPGIDPEPGDERFACS
jgi:uncharacterized protein (TIGR02757 family)